MSAWDPGPLVARSYGFKKAVETSIQSYASHKDGSKEGYPPISVIVQKNEAAVEQLKLLVETHTASSKTLQNSSNADDGEEPLLLVQKYQTIFSEFLASLDTHEQALHAAIEDTTETCTTTPLADIPAEDIISYAHKLRHTTFASLGVLPGAPPNPQTWHMQNSALYKLSKLASTFTDASMEAVAAPEPPAAKKAKVDALTANVLESHVDSNLLDVTPPASAWRPSFEDLPPPPPGWKPGDPLPLANDLSPTADGQVQSIKREPEQPKVANFNFSLILNPDLEVEEDYSSEEYSDDE